MKLALSFVFALALCLGLVVGVSADEKEMTFEGKVTCAKCELKKENKCATVLVVKDGYKDVIYWFDKDSNKKYHGEICSEGKEAKVTFKVVEKEGKKWISVSKLEWKKS